MPICGVQVCEVGRRRAGIIGRAYWPSSATSSTTRPGKHPESQNSKTAEGALSGPSFFSNLKLTLNRDANTIGSLEADALLKYIGQIV